MIKCFFPSFLLTDIVSHPSGGSIELYSILNSSQILISVYTASVFSLTYAYIVNIIAKTGLHWTRPLYGTF